MSKINVLCSDLCETLLLSEAGFIVNEEKKQWKWHFKTWKALK